MNNQKNYEAFGVLFNELKENIKEELLKELEPIVIAKYKAKKLFYSLKEVSHITGLTIHAIKGRYRRKNLSVVYDGTTPLIPSDEVNRLIEKLNKQL